MGRTKEYLEDRWTLLTCYCPHQFVSRANKVSHSVRASREIIVAAGAVHSPQILQLSGIGPKKLLSSLGIETLVDLPGVGYSFQDQSSMYPVVNCRSFQPPMSAPTDRQSHFSLMIDQTAALSSVSACSTAIKPSPLNNLQSTTRIAPVGVSSQKEGG